MVEYIKYFLFLVVIETICIFTKLSGSISVKDKAMARHWYYIYIYIYICIFYCDTTQRQISDKWNVIFTLTIFPEHWLSSGYSGNRMCSERNNKAGRNTKKFLHTTGMNRSGLFSIDRRTILPPFPGSNAVRLN